MAMKKAVSKRKTGKRPIKKSAAKKKKKVAAKPATADLPTLPEDFKGPVLGRVLRALYLKALPILPRGFRPQPGRGARAARRK